MDVTFAWLPASGGEREGVFVTANGGPGSSGISVADSYTSAFDPAIPERFDIVFFDQRGIGLSEPIQCPEAALAYYAIDVVPTQSDAELAAFAEASRAFSVACVDEIGIEPEELAAYGTRQAVEDLEIFRSWLDADQLNLYGESYGTQYVQAYAAAHPERVETLLIDGPVDLTLGGEAYWAEGVVAAEEVLLHALGACVEECAGDVEGGDLIAANDALTASLADGPLEYDFTLADGTVERRELSLADVESAAISYIYSTTDEMLLQRAVAYAARGDLAPMARLTALALGYDADTLEPIEDPTWSDALYYAVECMDYAYGSGTSEEREAAFLAFGEAAGVAEHRLGSGYYGDLPCTSWPVHPSSDERPDYLTADTYPIVILASTTDPATPYAGALRLFENSDGGYLVTTPGGPHVIYGRGDPCPDELVNALILEGELPTEPETECEPMLPDPYLPLPPASVTAATDPVTAIFGADDEINTSPDYWAWSGVDKLRYGCLYGGSIAYEPVDAGYAAHLEDCAFSDGLPLTGDALIDDVKGTFTLDVTAPGGTELAYVRDIDGAISLSGTWFGDAVEIEG